MKTYPKNFYPDIFTEDFKKELEDFAGNGCECEVNHSDFYSWIQIPLEDLCQQCMCELILIAVDRARCLRAEAQK